MTRKAAKYSLRVHWILLSVGLLFNVAALFLLWWDGSRSPYVDSSFSYTADIIETDNIYDKDNKRFVGSSYIPATFQLSLKNTDEGSKIFGELTKRTENGPVKQAGHDQRVDVATGRYQGEEADAGYIFAPKGITKDTSFYYRHLVYNVPALMRFAGEETIEGLIVYRFKAEYNSNEGRIEAMQDEHTALAAGQVLEYTPDLQVWIEPTSGWMVKYRDDTTLNIHNQATNEVVQPLRYFSNSMSNDSVNQHVAYAKTLHQKAVFMSQIAPSIFVLVIILTAFGMALIRLRSTRSIPIHAALVVITILPAIALFAWLVGMQPLTTFFISNAGINPVVAFCFVLVGLAIIARHNKYPLVMAFLGGVIGITATLQIFGSLGVLPFQIDLLLFRERVIAFDEISPSRMSLFGSFTFLILSVVLIKAGLTTSHTRFHFARFMVGVVVALGVFGGLLQFLQVDQVFTISFIKSLSIITCLLFIVSGLTLLQLFRQIHAIPNDLKSVLRALMWPSIATVPIIIIGMFAQLQQNVVRQTLETRLNETISQVEGTFFARMDVFSNTLAGATGLFASSQEVTEEEWHSFIANYHLPETFPGISAFGYAKLAPKDALSVETTAQGMPVSIFPDSNSQDMRAPIIYIEPKSKVTSKYIGRSLFSEAALAETLKQARDSGRSRLSSQFIDPELRDTDGVDALLVSPVYHQGMNIGTVNGRREAIQGYVFGAINVRRLIESVINTRAGEVDFEIYDGLDVKSEALMYRRYPEFKEGARLSEKSTIFLADQPWTVVYAAKPNYRLSTEEEISPTIILVGGSLAYFVVVALGYVLVDMNRRMQLASQEHDKRSK